MTSTVWKLNVSGTRYPALDGTESLSCELKRLNIGKITCATSGAPITVGTAVLLEEYDGTTYRILLDGYIKKYSVVSKPRNYLGVNQGIQYICKYEIAERAVELEQYRVNTAGVRVVNTTAGTLKSIVTTVLSGSGWTLNAAVPAGATLPALQFKWTAILTALEKLVIEMGATSGTPHYWLWFETISGVPGGTVYYGTQRNDRTSRTYNSTVYYQYEDIKNNNKKQIDGVTILGFNNASEGMYPAIPAGNNIAVYSYTAATTNAECLILATNLYNDYLKDPERRVQFKITPQNMLVGGVAIQEGDLINVDGNNWIIVDLFYTPKEVQVGVQAGDISEFGRLGTSLVEVTGTIGTASEQSWDGGWQDVGVST